MRYLVSILGLLFFSQTVFSKTESLPPFEIYSKKYQAVILYDKEGSKLDSIASYLLAEDIYKVTHYKPKVITNISEAQGNVIVIGNIGSELMKPFINKKSITADFLQQWESYLYRTVLNPNQKIKKAFVIAGTNPRGTAYGVFDLSQKIGVSPWHWWSDVPAKVSKELIIQQLDFIVKHHRLSFVASF